MTTIKDAPVVELLIGTEKFPISDGSGKPVTATIQLIIDKCSGVPIVDSEDKLDSNAPLGSLGVVAYNIVTRVSVRDLYQPTVDDVDMSSGEIFNPEKLSKVDKLEFTFPESVSAEGFLKIYLVPRTFGPQNEKMLTIGYESDNGVVQGLGFEEMASDFTTYKLCQYDENGVPSVNQENIDILNSLLTTDDWYYLSDPGSEFVITEDQFDILDKFFKVVSGSLDTTLYINKPEGYKNIFDVESTINNITGNEKILINNDGKPSTITVNLILNKVDLSNYTTTEIVQLAVQNVNQKADKANTTATNALNLAEGIQGSLSSFALKSELPTKVSQLENDADYLPNTIQIVENGVYVVDINGDLHDPNIFTGTSDDVTGIGLVTDNVKMIIALDEWYSTSESTAWNGNIRSAWGGYKELVTDCFWNHQNQDHMLDFDGEANTDAIINQLKGTTDRYNGQYYTGAPAAEYCRAYSKGYKDVGSWYLPAAGELNEIVLNKDVIDVILAKLGKNSLSSMNWTWSSSQCDSNDAWLYSWISSKWDHLGKYNGYGVRPICKLEAYTTITTRIESLEGSVSDLESKTVLLENQLSDVYTKEEVDDLIPTDYITEEQLTLKGYITEEAINNNLSNNYYTKSEVDAKILELLTLINNYINGTSQPSELDT